MPLDYLEHTYKYQLGINTHVPGKTKPNDWGTCSYCAFGDSTMTASEAVVHSREILDRRRRNSPEAVISGTLYELTQEKDKNSRMVENFEHPKEQPA